jgi:threonine dehydrogenase-like Zn-dependent dehydrogenase
MMVALAPVLLALVVNSANTSTSPPAAVKLTAAAAAAAAPAARPLGPVVINGVLFRAVEFDTGKAVWRNLAITVTSNHLDDWRALPAAIKSTYAEQMIDNYRAGMKYDRDIKLTFTDEHNATLDQYLWTPPAPDRK